MTAQFANCSFHFLDMGDAYAAVIINNQHIKTPTMYRLLIPEVLSNLDKCIYLDSDLVVEGEIAELYDIDVEGFCIAGVRGFFVAETVSSEWFDTLKIPTLDDYINAGVLVWNLHEIRLSELEKELVKAGYNDYYRYNDQDAINVVCYGRIKKFPVK